MAILQCCQNRDYIVDDRIINKYESVDRMRIGRESRSPGRKLVWVTFFTTNPTFPHLGSNLSCRCGEPATVWAGELPYDRILGKVMNCSDIMNLEWKGSGLFHLTAVFSGGEGRSPDMRCGFKALNFIADLLIDSKTGCSSLLSK
jgi:hypothetical protein